MLFVAQAEAYATQRLIVYYRDFFLQGGDFGDGIRVRRRAQSQIRNFAEGMAACPHRVAFGDELMIVGVAPRGGGGEFFGNAGANEDSVLAQILKQIFGDTRAEIVNGKRRLSPRSSASPREVISTSAYGSPSARAGM